MCESQGCAGHCVLDILDTLHAESSTVAGPENWYRVCSYPNDGRTCSLGVNQPFNSVLSHTYICFQ